MSGFSTIQLFLSVPGLVANDQVMQQLHSQYLLSGGFSFLHVIPLFLNVQHLYLQLL
jgi:hypothetical protein